jgi:hypothetical protein
VGKRRRRAKQLEDRPPLALPLARQPAAESLAAVTDHEAPPGDVIPALARLLRRLRDRAPPPDLAPPG